MLAFALARALGLGLLAELLSSIDISLHLIQPPCVDSGVSRQLGVEAGAENIALPDSHDIANLLIGVDISPLSGAPSRGSRQGGQHLDMIGRGSFRHRVLGLPGRCDNGIFAFSLSHLDALSMWQNTFHNGGSDKDGRERRCVFTQEWKLQRSLETLGLSAKVIAVDSNIKTSDEFLTTLLGLVGRLGEQDQTCASAPSWLAVDSVQLRHRQIRSTVIELQSQRGKLT
jgi:hypothetical protein